MTRLDINSVPQRHPGTVKSWNADVGYGFICSNCVQGDVYFWRNQLPAEIADIPGKFLQEKKVSFDLVAGPDGRARGYNIQFEPGEVDLVAGKVISYSERTEYGFIRSASPIADIRFNRAALPPLSDVATLGNETVVAVVRKMPDGKLRADKVFFQPDKTRAQLKAPKRDPRDEDVITLLHNLSCAAGKDGELVNKRLCLLIPMFTSIVTALADIVRVLNQERETATQPETDDKKKKKEATPAAKEAPRKHQQLKKHQRPRNQRPKKHQRLKKHQ